MRGSDLGLTQNLRQHLRHLQQHLTVAKADYSNPARAQVTATLGILVLRLITEVLPTIQLDRQAQRCTVEIQHIGW